MSKEIKIYTDFIKKNKIVTNKEQFVYYTNNVWLVVPLTKLPGNKWYADYDGDIFYSKKACIYYYVRNNFKDYIL